MRRPDLIDLGIVAAAFALAYRTSPRDDDLVVTIVFGTLVGTGFGLLVRVGVSTFRSALAERRRGDQLAGIDPVETARRTVLAERRWLSSELDSCIRDALVRVRAEVTAMDSDPDPRPRARRIQMHAREATTELRRQLGLLRAREDDVRPARSHAAPRRTDRPDLRDVLLAAAVALLAGLETLFIGRTEFTDEWRGAWVPLTMVAAATLVGRRTLAPQAAVVCAVMIGAGWALPGMQVASGAWMMLTLGGLGWTLGAAPVSVRSLAAFTALALTAGGSRLAEDPENAGILVVTLVVAWVIGLVVGWNRRRHAAASARSAALQAELDTATERAVAAERVAVARELHDVVSHAVGVIATQAAAAEVSWPAEPETALRALATIAASADTALAELDRVVPGKGGADGHDVDALVGRIRAAGTVVVLRRSGTVPQTLEPVVYRIVQEGLTNAVKHAPGAAVQVVVAADEGHVRVTVADDGAGAASGQAAGFGLTGLRERVTLLGGRLRAGPGPDGGFVVEVELPVRQEVDA